MIAVECRNFSFSYGPIPSLYDISFKLEQGDWLTLIGPNGAGKSTLLKCMLRLTEGGRNNGELSINERPLESYTQVELARQLAYVPQAAGRIPPFLVEDFVNLSRYPYAWRGVMSQPSTNVRAALKLTGTDGFAKQRMDTLSGGQRQRVYLAAALAQETGILLLDEPAAFLDPHHVSLMNDLLKKLHSERGLTIITVTHDLSLPFDIGGKALVLANGRQLYYGAALAMGSNGILEQAFCHKFSYLSHPLTGKTIVAI